LQVEVVKIEVAKEATRAPKVILLLCEVDVLLSHEVALRLHDDLK
jgi:hypothetical protein